MSPDELACEGHLHDPLLPAIKTTRRVIKFFKKSTHANSHLRSARKTFKVTRGLVSIGKTRFGTMYFSGASHSQHFAVKIFDVTVNSMADERTASTMNWLNSALRSSLKSSTIVSQVQVRQWALMDPERTKRPPSKPTVKFRDLESTLFNVDLDSNGQKRKHDNSESQAEANPEPQDSNSDSEDNWLEESEDPEIERDPMYWSCDTRVLVGSEDAHLDAPRLLDLLSEKPVEGASRTPQLQDSTVPTPPGGPVQWAFALP